MGDTPSALTSLTLRPPPHAPLSHLSARSVPLPSTSKRSNGQRVKRGRGQGEEEEADPSHGTGHEGPGRQHSLEILLAPANASTKWCFVEHW